MLNFYRFQKDSAKVRNIFELAKNTATRTTITQLTDTQCQDVADSPKTSATSVTHSFYRNHTILTSISGTYSLHPQGQQHSPHIAHAFSSESTRETLLQSTEDFRRRQLYTLLPFQWQTETTEKDILFRSMFVEDAVMFLYLTFFFRRKPIAFTTKKFRLQFGIELGIIRTGTVNLSLHLHTEKTTASRSVCQQFLLIARTNERSNTRQLTIITTTSSLNSLTY